MTTPTTSPADDAAPPVGLVAFLSVFHPWEALPEPGAALALAMGAAGWWYCPGRGPVYGGDRDSARASLVVVALMLHRGRDEAGP